MAKYPRGIMSRRSWLVTAEQEALKAQQYMESMEPDMEAAKVHIGLGNLAISIYKSRKGVKA
jgi:hypothetical protein